MLLFDCKIFCSTQYHYITSIILEESLSDNLKIREEEKKILACIFQQLLILFLIISHIISLIIIIIDE